MFLTSLFSRLEALATSLDWITVIKTAAIFAVVLFAAGTVIRLVLGKGSNLTCAVSASLSVLLVYLAALLLYLFLPEIRAQLSQLPFVFVDDQRFILRTLSELSEPVFYGSLVRLALLAFLVNLLESLLPQGETFLRWYLWRGVTVLLALALYSFFTTLIEAAAPQVFTIWAKYVILGAWTVILLSGALKVLFSLVLTVVNPIIGFLYTFFFSNLFGSQFSKSILTTLILVALIAALNHLGLRVFSFDGFSLAAYGPTCIIAIVTLYLFGKFL